MLNIVLPMAGRGSRFAIAGYSMPKPLIDVKGKPMIDVVVHNIAPIAEHRFIFIVLREHLELFNLEEHLRVISPGCEIVPVDQVTEGAACTVLLARKHINNEESLMIANCDQYVDTDINGYLSVMENENADGLVMTMKATDAKWSFMQYDAEGAIKGIIEKKVVSDEATVGIYNFSHGKDFVRAAETMIEQNLRVNNEFYVAPVYNILLQGDYRIATCNIGTVLNGMYGLGTPEDLELFLKEEISNRAADFENTAGEAGNYNAGL